MLGEVERVGVDAVGSEHLRTDRDDLGVHASRSLNDGRGGQLSQGDNHLTEYMPAPIAAVLGVSNPVQVPANSPNGGRETFYGARIHPILAQHCVSCHGRNKHKANLRLDSFEAAMRGGKHGPVIKAGDVKASELFRRITLSPSDDDFMPAGKRPLGSKEVKVIEQWIAAGASGTAPKDDIGEADGSPAKAVAEVTFEDVDPEGVTRQRTPVADSVVRLQQRFPNVLDYRSRGSADIVVNAAWMQAKFRDEDLAALSPLADHIVIADFSNTAITDKSAVGIGAMKHLRVLRLMHTHIGDDSLQSLKSLSELESLSLFATLVVLGGVGALSRLPKLQHVYVGGTKISADAHVSEELVHKLVF